MGLSISFIFSKNYLNSFEDSDPKFVVLWSLYFVFLFTCAFGQLPIYKKINLSSSHRRTVIFFWFKVGILEYPDMEACFRNYTCVSR